MTPETLQQFLIQNQWLIILSVLWTLPWKGVALWKASKKGQKGWFMAILILNTLAVLEILYIFLFSKKKEKKEVSVS